MWPRFCLLMVLMIVTALVATCANPASAGIIDTVTIANAGNAPDTWSGYGGVNYVFQMGKFEVSAAQYCEFLNAVAGASDPYGLYYSGAHQGSRIQRFGSSYFIAPDWANRPMNEVSWGDAARFANWLHNGKPTGILTGNPVLDSSLTEDGSYFLNGATSDTALLNISRKPSATWVIPNENEWVKAAYHKNDGVTGNYWWYATSSDYPSSNALVTPDPGNRANFFDFEGIGTGGYSIGEPYYRTIVGDFENSGSPYGTFDQLGNVEEWTEGTRFGTERVLRGGSYNTGPVSRTDRHGIIPSVNHWLIGFRVALVPEPSSIMFIALALAGVGKGRRCARR